jgi:dUTP pyrophosphatase
VEIEVKILDQRVIEWGFPAYGSEFAAGLDLYACINEPLILRPYQPAMLVSSGIAIKIRSAEWCGLVIPRSGLGHAKGLVLGNAVGLIDPDYTGACYISAWNRNMPDPVQSEAGEITINPGDRIAQLVLLRTERPRWNLVESLSPTARADRGFGASGQSWSDAKGE